MMNNNKETFSVDNYNDEDLLKLSLDNNDFFTVLVNRYKQRFFYYLKAFAGFRNDEIEDVIQNSFIKIYKNLNNFDSKLKFSSWAYRIVHNEAIDEIRRQKRSNLPLFPELEIPDDKNDLMEDLDEKFEKKIVMQVLQELKDDYREVLVLRFFEDRDYKEISDILRRPLGTVCTLISRAKNQFKNKYKKYAR